MVTVHLVAALRRRVEFQPGEHCQLLRDDHTDIRGQISHNTREELTAVTRELFLTYVRHIRLVQKTGAWIFVTPSTVNGIYLGEQ